MHPISTATHVMTYPARATIAAASAGVRGTVRLLARVTERAADRQAATRNALPVVVPDPRPARSDVDPMVPTRTPPPAPPSEVPPSEVPTSKVRADHVPLKSTPTPSLPAGVEAIDDAIDEVGGNGADHDGR